MTRRRAFGLRPRLLAALVATSVVTLGVAALALLPPLQQRLTDQAASDLENATAADVKFFQQRIAASLRGSIKLSRQDRLDQLRFDLGRRAFTLRDRTGARVVVVDSIPGEQPLADTDFGGTPLPTRPILDTLISPTPHTVRNGDEIITTQPLSVPPVKGDRNPPDTDFVLVTQKQLTDVATAVHQVRNAFVAAAAAGLAVAVLLGILLATGIGRRLARLRAAAVRVAEEGTDAPTPRDDGLDEVGDLARALATMQRELRRQEAARRSFVATASHELRTPLTSLQGTIELLEEDLRDGRRRRSYCWPAASPRTRPRNCRAENPIAHRGGIGGRQRSQLGGGIVPPDEGDDVVRHRFQDLHGQSRVCWRPAARLPRQVRAPAGGGRASAAPPRWRGYSRSRPRSRHGRADPTRSAAAPRGRARRAVPAPSRAHRAHRPDGWDRAVVTGSRQRRRASWSRRRSPRR